MGPEVEDVPELMHNIQSCLPLKEAVRTSVLSKSWLHAWSTIPTLSFDVRRGKQLKLIDVDRTLIRYLRDNVPIETFDLKIDIENQESASHAENLIGPVSSRTCLKEISLLIFVWGASFMLPDEILAGENLTKIRVSAPIRWKHFVRMRTPVINCVTLRKLHLDGVCMSEEALHGILSSCSLLEKINLLHCCKGFKTIKVKNLPRLYKLRISLDECGYSTALEINDVPNLVEFSYDLHVWGPPMPVIPFNAHSISLGDSVTQLRLGGVMTDNACLDKINSGFPFLESLTLDMVSWKLGRFHFTCASVKRLSLLSCSRSLIDVQVYAPKLHFFEFRGDALPSFSFPVSSLKQTKVSLSLTIPVEANFFLRMREALTLSRTFTLRISADYSKLQRDIDIDDLRTGLGFPPATNVQELWFDTRWDEGLWERSSFFDAFFEICHPKRVYAVSDLRFRHNNHFCRLMLREVLEKTTAYWPHYLKHVQIRGSRYQNWKTVTDSHRSLLDGSAPGVSMFFKLNWL